MFAILFEVLLIEIREEIHHFAGWEVGVKGHKNCEQKFCEQTGVSYLRNMPLYSIQLGTKLLHTVSSLFWEIIFGNKFQGELINVM